MCHLVCVCVCACAHGRVCVCACAGTYGLVACKPGMPFFDCEHMLSSLVIHCELLVRRCMCVYGQIKSDIPCVLFMTLCCFDVHVRVCVCMYVHVCMDCR